MTTKKNQYSTSKKKKNSIEEDAKINLRGSIVGSLDQLKIYFVFLFVNSEYIGIEYVIYYFD